MSKDWRSKAQQFIKNASEHGAEAVAASQKRLDEAGVTEKAASAMAATQKFLDEKGVTEKVSTASAVANEHLDTFAGVKQLKLVEERMELQSQYNDILAEKLQEALKRIEVLEQRLYQVKSA